MDFLNQAYAQLADLLRSMPPATRVTTALLLIVVVVSVGYLFTHGTSGPGTDLMNGVSVSPSQLASMEAAFYKAGLTDYEVRGTQILVPSGKKAAYMAALADGNALPPNIESVFDNMFQDVGAFTSADERAQRMKIAKERMLAMIIGTMGGVDSAYVMYDTQLRDGLRRERLTTASINVKPVGSNRLDESQVSAIRNVVAASIANLKPENVTVTDLNSGYTFAGDLSSENNPGGTLYIQVKQKYEEDWRDKILKALAYVPGVSVTPNVVLDRERLSRMRAIKYNPKPTALHEMEQNTSSTREGQGPAGRPGLAAQQPNTPATLSNARGRTSREEEEQSKREVQSVADTEQTEKETVGLTPKLVAVSIGIPASYFLKIWEEQNPTESGAEPAKPDAAALDQIRQAETTNIQAYVANLLPDADGVADKNELVKVNVFQDLKGEAIPEPALADQAVGWLGQYWSTLGMFGLALVSLLMLRSMVRGGPAVEQAAVPKGVLPNDMGDSDEEAEAAAAIAGRLKRPAEERPLRDELADVVSQDPETAANILKAWIGSVN